MGIHGIIHTQRLLEAEEGEILRHLCLANVAKKYMVLRILSTPTCYISIEAGSCTMVTPLSVNNGLVERNRKSQEQSRKFDVLCCS